MNGFGVESPVFIDHESIVNCMLLCKKINQDAKSLQSILSQAARKKLDEIVAQEKEPEREPQKSVEPEPELEPEPEKEEEEDAFQCVGRVWRNPPEPCQGGKRAHIRVGIMYDKRRYDVCKECKLSRDRDRRRAKRKKDAELAAQNNPVFPTAKKPKIFA